MSLFKSSPWAVLVVAGLLEVCWSIGLKYPNGFTRLRPTLFTLATLTASMYRSAKASESLPIGTAYGVWVGIGSMGAAILGIILLDEPASAPRIGFLALLLISIIGLKLTS